MFVVTNVVFVFVLFFATSMLLLRQKICRDKHTFVADKRFAATKLILVAALASDTMPTVVSGQRYRLIAMGKAVALTD